MLVITRLGSSVLGPGCVWHRNFAGLTAVHPHWGAAVGQRRCGHRGSLGGEGGRDACPGAESKTGGTWHRFKDELKHFLDWQFFQGCSSTRGYTLWLCQNSY